MEVGILFVYTYNGLSFVFKVLLRDLFIRKRLFIYRVKLFAFTLHYIYTIKKISVSKYFSCIDTILYIIHYVNTDLKNVITSAAFCTRCR